MEKRKSVSFFLKFLLLTVITFVLVVVSFALISMEGAAAVVGLLLILINVILLLVFFFMSWWKLLRHILDKQKEYFDFMYIINVLFTTLITGIFIAFYFIISMGILIILLPFLA